MLQRQFGRRVRKLRTERKWTQEDLAERLDVTWVYISNLENGRRSPSFALIERISLVFHVPVMELFRFDE
jgi:transcriptional regulator with XRE-family HTH domain